MAYLKDEVFDYVYQKHLDRVKKKYWEAKEKHLCTACRRVPAVEGKTRCAECAKIFRNYGNSRYKTLAAKGICIRCGVKPAREGRVKCFECAVIDNERVKSYYYRRKAANENNKSV